MSAAITLSRGAFALLLRLLNSPSGVISGEVMHELSPGGSEELIKAGILKPSTSALSVIEVDEHVHELVWFSDDKRYKYFSSGAGWIAVSPEAIKHYVLQIGATLDWLKGIFEIDGRCRTTEIHTQMLWFLGGARPGNTKVSIYFVRALHTAHNVQLFLSALKKEVANASTMFIASSNIDMSLTGLPLDMALVALDKLLSRKGKIATLDHAMVKSIINGDTANASGEGGIGLRFSTDYRLVHWNGEEYKLTKKQAAVIEALDREDGRAHKDLLCVEANTNEEIHRVMRNKVNGKWVSHPLWNSLIMSCGNGYYTINTS